MPCFQLHGCFSLAAEEYYDRKLYYNANFTPEATLDTEGEFVTYKEIEERLVYLRETYYNLLGQIVRTAPHLEL